MVKYLLIECKENNNNEPIVNIIGELKVSNYKTAEKIAESLNHFADIEGKFDFCYYVIEKRE